MKPPPSQVAAPAAEPTPQNRHVPFAVACVLVGLVLAMFADVLFTDSSVALGHEGSDMDGQFLAWRSFAFGQLRKGHLPLWNPHVFGGAPFLGGGQSALLYPPNFLYMALPLRQAVNLGIALHVLLLGWLMYLWMRRRRLSPPAALLSAVVIMFGGAHFAHVYAGHLPNLCTMAWAPLIFLAIDGLLEGPRLRWPLLGAAAVALQILAGHTQYVFYTGLAAVLYFLLHLPSAPRRLHACLRFVAVYAGAVALAAVHLLTTIDAAAESVRAAGLPFKEAATFSFPPENLLSLLAPEAFGRGGDQPYWGRGNWWEMSLFIGAAALVLVVYGLLRGPRGQRLRPALMVAVLLLLAFGANTPLFRLLYNGVPGFRQFRGISKFIFQASLFIAMLAGMGFDALRRRGWTGPRPAIAVGIAAAGLAGLALAVHLGADAGQPWWRAVVKACEEPSPGPFEFTYTDPFIRDAGRQAAAALLIGSACLAAAACALLSLRLGPRAAWLMLVLAVVELFVFARTHRATFDFAAAADSDVGAVLRRLPPGDWRVLRALAHNEPMLCGFDDLWGSDPMILQRYAQWIAHTQGADPDQATQSIWFLDKRSDANPTGLRLHRLYSMLRLRYAINTFAAPGHAVTTRPDAMPQLNLLYDYLVRPDRDSAFAAMDSPAFDPRRTVILESDPSGGTGQTPVLPGMPAAARLIDRTTDRLTIEADLPAPAILLITDSYSRGWHARPLPGSAQTRYRVQPANYCLQAVGLSAGRHRFILEYRPTAFVVGKWVSIIALAGYLLLWAWHLRPRPGGGKQAPGK